MSNRQRSQGGSHGHRPGSSASSSTKSSSRRPKSRASTASAHSISTQLSQHQGPNASFGLQQQPSQPQQHQDSFQYSPEDMIIQSAHRLTNPNGLVIDPALENPNNHVISFPTNHGSVNHPELENASGSEYLAYTKPNGSVIDLEDPMDIQDTPEPGERDMEKPPTKKGSNSSIANDRELRRLYTENKHLSIKQAAMKVLQSERTPMAEKSKQTFAMLWLNAVCRRASGSVPRSRVFSHYATRCGTERVPTLNPASFGKLVRVIFPGITTRRLGMRGESKYHYVDLSLDEDHQGMIDAERAQTAQETSYEAAQPIPGPRPSRHLMDADTAVFPSTSMTFPTFDRSSKIRHSRASTSVFIDSKIADPSLALSKVNRIERKLKFLLSEEGVFRQNEPIELPSISKYIPPGTDSDNAGALTALYRSHCTSLIDCIRFCKEKSFFHHFTSFHGTLTVPVQKLLANPCLAPWIHECDWLMYQKMVRVVAPLTLQVVPEQVLDTFRVISQTLAIHVKKTFQHHPSHVIEAKLGPATIFAALLDRLLRVNAASHAAAKMLCYDANRDHMWEDWVVHANPLKVMEGAVPDCAYEKVLKILTVDIRRMLEPISTSSYLEPDTLFESASLHGNGTHADAQELIGTSTEGVLDRWTNFIAAIPGLFPQADAHTVINCINSVCTNALRNITIAQGKSFGSWWITKIWVDEMLLWMAEKGGFMDHSPSAPMPTASVLAMEVSEGFSADFRSRASSHGSHFSNADADVPTIGRYHSTNAGPPHRSVSLDAASQAALVAAAGFGNDQGHDDSGIGMSMTEEDISNLEKYGGFVTEGIGSAQAESDGVGGDVVVC